VPGAGRCRPRGTTLRRPLCPYFRRRDFATGARVRDRAILDGELAAGRGGGSFIANVTVNVQTAPHTGADTDPALAVQIGREVRRELRVLWAQELVEQQRPGNLLGGGFVA